MKYNEWKIINESLGFTLGLSKIPTIATQGSQLEGLTLRDFEDEEVDDEEDIDDDETDLTGDEDMAGEKFGDDAESNFPPDESDEMGGADDDMLGDIDPDLAGLGDDEMGMGDDPMMGDSPMGDDPMGDPMMGDMPCELCNPDGEMEEGDPGCELCGGEGFVAGEGGEGGEMGDIDAAVETGDQDQDFAQLMSKMDDYCRKYMRKKFMDKEEKCDDKPKHKSHGKKPEKKDDDKKGKSDFFSSLHKQAEGNIGKKFSSGIYEDALLPPPEEPAVVALKPGDVGFAPHAKIGGIGAGYTQDDIASIPVLGESKKRYPTLTEYMKSKKRGS